MMRFHDEGEAVTYIFKSMRKLRGQERGLDERTRDVAPTRRLLAARNLLGTPREYAVVTGSKGKGSTTVITSKLLQHLGHRVGTITSPHLISWRERIRVNGRAIPEEDFLRILDDLAPDIDAIEETLSEHTYFSPQGIFLAVALQWFDEQHVQAAVLEVGRGGRFDDIAVVPNKLALFTPIMLEHAEYMGPTPERIAWHKAGIIKAYGYAYSLPQSPEVMRVIQAEADALGAEFNWIAERDMAEYLGENEDGLQIQLGRYGELTLSLMGRYQIPNATLAVIAAGNMHARLHGVPHGSAEYITAIRAGLSDVRWPGRCQKLQDNPTVFIDGAINYESAQLMVQSVENHLRAPVVSILCVPSDKDYDGVYRALGTISQHVILTETRRNPSLHWLDEADALQAARKYHSDVQFHARLEDAVEAGKHLAGKDGTLLIVGTQSIVAETVGLWGMEFEVI